MVMVEQEKLFLEVFLLHPEPEHIDVCIHKRGILQVTTINTLGGDEFTHILDRIFSMNLLKLDNEIYVITVH